MRLGAWIIIVPALALFSFSVVAGAARANSKPGLETAAAKVVPSAHDDGSVHGVGQSDKQKQDDGTFGVRVVSESLGKTR